MIFKTDVNMWLGQSFFVFFLSTTFNIFSFTLTEEVCPDRTHPMLFTVKWRLYAKVLGL